MKKIYTFLSVTLIYSSMAISQPAGWQYIIPISVTEQSGNTLINYQLHITMNTQALIANSQMNSNGDDIRFRRICTGQNLNYWIESGINTASTSIWVRIDTLPANSTINILMFYGNPSAASASSLSTFFGPYSATDSVTVPTINTPVGNSQRGFRFMPNEDVLVTSFGKNEPNGTTRYVTLFNYVTQTITAQTQISGPAGSYSYNPLPSPVWLTSGTQYVLELYQGTNDGYYYGTSNQISQHLSYFDMRYCNTCTQNSFPTDSLPNYHYGLPDLWYYTKSNATPAPTYSLGSAYQPANVFAGNDTSFCAGAQVQIGNTAISGYPPISYSWNPSTGLSSSSIASPTASPLSTTTYIETASDSFGCAASDSVTLTVQPLPVVSFSLAADTICVDASPLALNGAPPGGNYSGPGIYSDTLYPDSAGLGMHIVSYTYTDSLGCTNSAADSIIIDICTGVTDLLSENYFSVYPNPVQDESTFTIFFNDNGAEKEISLFDSLGKMVLNKKSNLKLEKVNVGTLSGGIYFLQISFKDKTLFKKIVKS